MISILQRFKFFLIKALTNAMAVDSTNSSELKLYNSDFEIIFSVETNIKTVPNEQFIIIKKISYLYSPKNYNIFAIAHDSNLDHKLLQIVTSMMIFNITQKNRSVNFSIIENGYECTYNKKRITIDYSLNNITITAESNSLSSNNNYSISDQFKIISTNDFKCLINYKKEIIDGKIKKIHQQLQIKIKNTMITGHISKDIISYIENFFTTYQIEKYIFADAIIKNDIHVLNFYGDYFKEKFYWFITDTYWIISIYKLEYLNSIVKDEPNLFWLMCKEGLFCLAYNFEVFEKQINSNLSELLRSDNYLGLKLLLESLYIYAKESDVADVIKFLLRREDNLQNDIVDIYYQIDVYHKIHYQGYQHWELDDVLTNL
jgi:hypothetical protein